MSKSPRQPTPEQTHTLDEFIKEYGRQAAKFSAPRAHDGIIRGTIECTIGTWELSIDTEGTLRYDCLSMRLLDKDIKPAPGVVTLDEYLKDVPDGGEVDGWKVER